MRVAKPERSGQERARGGMSPLTGGVSDLVEAARGQEPRAAQNRLRKRLSVWGGALNGLGARTSAGNPVNGGDKSRETRTNGFTII